MAGGGVGTGALFNIDCPGYRLRTVVHLSWPPWTPTKGHGVSGEGWGDERMLYSNGI